MSIDGIRRSVMGLTAIVLLAGGLYGLLGPFGSAARLPVGGAVASATVDHQMWLMSLLLWGMIVLAAGVFVFIGLVSCETPDKREIASIRPLLLVLQWTAFVMAVAPAALMSLFAPMEWLRPLFYAPFVMIAVPHAVACVRSWHAQRAGHKENRS